MDGAAKVFGEPDCGPARGPDLFDKFADYRERVALLGQLDNMPFCTVIDRILGPCEVEIAGRRTLMLGSNNYLGLTMDPELIQIAKDATEHFGVGTTGSRVANGSYEPHVMLEREIASFMDKRHAMVFTTGAQTNFAVIGTLAGPGDTILLDADNHATVWDACKLSGSQIVRFRHNDMGDLDRKLGRLDPASSNKLVIVEGCYSMAGDLAPLDELVEIKARHNAYLLSDEAHSFGVFGELGRGAGEHYGVHEQVDFITGTFSKSLAGVGGFCVSDHDALQMLHFTARPYMFTASSTPASIASVRGALRMVRERPELRERLWAAAGYMREGLSTLGFRLASGESPIIAIVVGEAIQTAMFWNALLEAGLYTNLFLPPATPKDACLIRTSYSAAHTPELLDRALEIFARVGRAHGVIPAR
jgi:8-amino-7-oxononanoate synthase